MASLQWPAGSLGVRDKLPIQHRKRAMSAVSAESPRGSADLIKSPASAGEAPASPPGNGAGAQADFGSNQWLVDELYQRYLADPGSVDQAWWSFFADYHPQPESASPHSPAASGGPQAVAGEAAPSSATSGGPSAGVAPTTGREAGSGGGQPATTSANQAAAPGSGAAVSASGRPGGAPAVMPSGAPGAAAPRTGAATLRTATAAPGARAEAAGTVPSGPGTAARPDSAAGGPDGTGGRAADARGGPAGVAAPGAGGPDQAGPEQTVRLRGAAARTAANMAASLTVPTATSVRAVPAKLLIDNRIVINNHLARGRGGKISFTHLIGYAIIRALAITPEMNYAYAEVDRKPAMLEPEHVNLGLAIDVRKDDRSRQLLVPSIKNAEALDFRQFWMAYEDIIRKARTGKLAVEDFAGTTISLTNPGTIGTEHSVLRLMPGQGCIVGVGAMEYPAAYQGASAETVARLAISQTVTLTSTYDHRIIQGAQSGEFLRIISRLLLGEDEFYEQIFTSLR